DDYDSEFHYAGRPTACVQGLDAHERTLYIGTFTKSLFPGLRIGYMVLPPAMKRARVSCASEALCPSCRERATVIGATSAGGRTM
ncbi:hypothetical protein ACV35R_34025, partial [Pseudomonas aeruginosa]